MSQGYAWRNLLLAERSLRTACRAWHCCIAVQSLQLAFCTEACRSETSGVSHVSCHIQLGSLVLVNVVYPSTCPTERPAGSKDDALVYFSQFHSNSTPALPGEFRCSLHLGQHLFAFSVSPPHFQQLMGPPILPAQGRTLLHGERWPAIHSRQRRTTHAHREPC